MVMDLQLAHPSAFEMGSTAREPRPPFFGKAKMHSNRVSAGRYFLNHASQHLRRDSLNQL
jgi:hypothetical protein